MKTMDGNNITQKELELFRRPERKIFFQIEKSDIFFQSHNNPGEFFIIRDICDLNRIIKITFMLNGLLTKIELESIKDQHKQIKLLERNFNGETIIYIKNCKHLLSDYTGLNYYLDYYHENAFSNEEIEEFLINEVIKLIKKIEISDFNENDNIQYYKNYYDRKISEYPESYKNYIKNILKYNFSDLKENWEFKNTYPSFISVLPPESRPDNDPVFGIIQLTQGCWYSQNGKPCQFCSSYYKIDYKEKTIDELDKHIDKVIDFYADGWRNIQRIFLADADPLFTKLDSIEYFIYFKQKLPKIEWYESFISTKTILSKKTEDWIELNKLGLKKVYWGIESGDNQMLQILRKPHNDLLINQAAQILKEANIIFVPIVLAGLALFDDKSISQNNHVQSTIALINNIKCEYIYISKLVITPNSSILNLMNEKILKQLTQEEIEDQYRAIISNINCKVRGTYGGQFIIENVENIKLYL